MDSTITKDNNSDALLYRAVTLSYQANFTQSIDLILLYVLAGLCHFFTWWLCLRLS